MSTGALLELSQAAVERRGHLPVEEYLRDKFVRLYQKKVLDIIFKKDAFDASKGQPGFLGGLAISLGKDDLSASLGRVSTKEAIDGDTPDDLWNYQVSPKVDGERFLMFLGSESKTVGSVNDTLLDIYFIDRYNKPYILQYGNKVKRIPTVRKLRKERGGTENWWSSTNMIPPCLIDGELLAVTSGGEMVDPRLVESEDIAYFSFVAFDILLGPDRPRYNTDVPSDPVWEYGANVAMCGPKVGGLHGRNWSFIKRFNVLNKILDPQGPYMETYSRVCPWFKTLLKPHYSINEFKKIAEASSRSLNIGLPSNTEFDGVIFTPKWGKYLISHGENRGQVAWVAPNNTVYKWKPVPTVDLLVKESGILYCGSEIKHKKIGHPLSKDNVGVGDGMNEMLNGIGEFTFHQNKWILIRDRSLERTKPNGCEVFEKTWNTIVNPVRKEDFIIAVRYYNTGRVSTREYLDKVMSENDLIKMVIYGGKMSLFSILDIPIEEKMERGVDAVRLAPGQVTEDMYHLLLQKMFAGNFPTDFPPEYLRVGELRAQPPPPPRPILMQRETDKDKGEATTIWFELETGAPLYSRTVKWNRRHGAMKVDLDKLYRVNTVSRKPIYLNFMIRSGRVVETTSRFDLDVDNVDVETKIRFILNSDWFLDMAEVSPLNPKYEDTGPDFRLTIFPRVEMPSSETLSQAVGVVFSILTLK